MEISIATEEEQTKIAHILGTLDDKIELNRRMNRTLEAMAQTSFKSWFVEFEPVKAKAAAKAFGASPAAIERAAMAAIAGRSIEEAIAQEGYFDDLTPSNRESLAQTAALFPDTFQASAVGQIPEGWTVRSLDKVAHYQNGLALQKFRPKRSEEPLPIVKISQLKTGEPTWEELASPSIKQECILDNGDVVFSWSGSLMVTLWCGGRAALNQHLFKVTSDEFPKWFYLFWTKKHLADFQQIAADKAVTMGHIKRSHLSAALCAIPNGDQLSKGTTILDPLVKQMICQELQSKTLAQLRDTLLTKFLSGELTVPAAQAQTEEAPA